MTNCNTCTDGSTCLSCLSPFYLRLDGTCQTDCSSKQQDKDGDYICKKCNLALPSCLDCNLAGIVCNQCDTGYFLQTNTCFLCSSYLKDCATCSDKSTCTQCSTQYLYSGQCQDTCPSTQQDKNGVRICKACSLVLSNCLECLLDGLQCKKCNDGFYVGTDFQCHQCLVPNCSACFNSGTECSNCFNPLKLEKNTNNCSSICPITEQDKDGDRKCQPCNDVLSRCIECTQDGLECSVCSQNSVLEQDGLCYPCSQIDTNCLTCSDKNTCTECNYPLKLSQNKCVSKCPLTEQDSNNDGVCKSCNQELNKRLVCSEDGIVCSVCEKGFHTNSQDQCEKCSQNIQNCSICSLNVSECFSCFSPLKLQSNICVDECFKNYFFDAQNICQFRNKKLSKNECKDQCSQYEQDLDKDNICQPCSLIIDNCQKCHESNDNLICDACDDSLILYDNKCQNCEFFFLDCVSCQNQSTCLQCKTLYLSQTSVRRNEMNQNKIMVMIKFVNLAVQKYEIVVNVIRLKDNATNAKMDSTWMLTKLANLAKKYIRTALTAKIKINAQNVKIINYLRTHVQRNVLLQNKITGTQQYGSLAIKLQKTAKNALKMELFATNAFNLLSFQRITLAQKRWKKMKIKINKRQLQIILIQQTSKKQYYNKSHKYKIDVQLEQEQFQLSVQLQHKETLLGIDFNL